MGKIVLEDFNDGNGYYKINLAYLNKEQVEEIENLVAKWKPTDEDIKSCIRMCLTDANEQRFKDYGTNLKDCLAWLEKQKEPPFVKDVVLGYPGHYFYDGERMHFCGNPAMEEKQKEQKPIKMEVYEVGKGTTVCGQDYKCKKDYMTGTCRYIKGAIYHCSRDGYLNDQNGVSWSCTPEWFKEYIQSNTEQAEEEKTRFVSGQFLQCKLSFDEFKEGEHYWLEYIGDDVYVGRSDNVLNQKFHITPRQLYTLFSQQLEEVQGPPQEEKQVSLNYEPPFDENPSDKEIIEALIHHLNDQNGFLTAINCVSTKAILCWLKKQKEQKPNRERNKPKESWLSNAKYEIEHADELLRQRQEELREIRKLKNQEQKPENELEDAFKYYTDRGISISCGDIKAEPNEEQKLRKFKLGDKVHWYDDDTCVMTITGFRDDAYLTDSAYGPILFCNEDNWEKVEQNPSEPSYNELQKHQDELYNFKVFAAKQAKEYHISFVHDFEWNNFCAELLSYFNEKQKPFNVCEQCPYYKDCPNYNEQKCIEGDNETEIQRVFREGKSAGRKEVFDHPEGYGLQKEQKLIHDIASGDAIESCMLRYLQSAANRKDDVEIIEDTKAYKAELISIIEKEQKPVLIKSDDKHMLERIMELVEFCNDKETIWNWLCEKVKEQKPADDKAFEEWIDDWWKHNKVNNPDSYDKGDEIQFDERGFKNFCRGIRNMYVEQKPAEIAPNQFDGITYGMQGYSTEKPAEKQDYSGLNDLERAIHRGFLAAGMENVPVTIIKETAKECLAQMEPAEWCDEDEKMLKWLCRIIHSRVVNKELSLAEESELGKWMDKWINHEPQHEKKWDEFDEDCLRRAIWYVENPAPSVVKDTNLVLWLQTLPGRFNLQPKEEWSEEDEEIFNNIIEKAKGGHWIEVNEITWLITRFKSLRPSWKPSEEFNEEDKQYFNNLIERIEKSRRTNRCYVYSDDVDWLKSKLNGNSCK